MVRSRSPAYAAAMAALILLAFALRFYRLDGQSLWYDEGVTAMVAQRGLADLTRWTAGDIQPPLYYYLVAGWGRLAGWGELSLRMPSALAGVLAVPLLAALALRLARQRTVALLAALLAAVHPLLVYYGQEARMYPLLIALAVLTGYLLARLADSPGPVRRLWAAYVVVATAAVYTHYFAFFFLAGLGGAYLLDRLRLQRQHVARAFWYANGLVLLLYLPWFGAMFTRLRVDRSYWAGVLKLAEALADVAVSFTSGETVDEQLARWLLIGYGAVTVLALYRLWRHREQSGRLLLYGMVWVLAPVAAVLALAMNVPKFNARYVMVALPGLLLLFAGGLGINLAQLPVRAQTGDDRRADGLRRAAVDSPLLCGVATIFLLAGLLFAVVNWYVNPAFTKDEWRQVVTFLRERLQPDEQVVLVSGHAWPVWDYYAPDIPAVRLPELEILDVDAVLDFDDTGPLLKQAFAEGSGKEGAWVVGWQDEVVDPSAVAPVQLELGGREKGQSATFYGLTLRRYSGLRPNRFQNAPPVEHPLGIRFGDQLLLHGYKVLNNGDLLLFWERLPGQEGAAADLRLALRTHRPDGAPLAQPADRRLAGYTYPSFRWPEHTIVMGHIPAADWLGASPQPGAVGFRLRVYAAADPAARPLTAADGRSEIEVSPVEVIID